MDFSELPYLAAKYAMLFLLAFLIYEVYVLIYRPWKERNYFMQYKNVDVCRKYYPLIGDIGRLFERRKENVFQFYDHLEVSMNKPEIDMKFQQLGTTSMLDMMSIEAQKELAELVPHSVDR
jgi:hypothetical protein